MQAITALKVFFAAILALTSRLVDARTDLFIHDDLFFFGLWAHASADWEPLIDSLLSLLSIRLRILFLAALIVHSLGAGGSIRARGDAHSILGLGMSASGGLGGLHPVLIRLL